MTEQHLDPAPVEPIAYDLVRLSFAIADRTNAHVGEAMAELNLTPTLANTLWHLDPARGDPSMGELAGRLSVDPSTITSLADKLERLGLLTREVDAGNRRVKTLVLTDAGRDTRRRLVVAMTTGSPTARLNSDEQRTLHALLSKAIGDSEPDEQPVDDDCVD